MADDLGAVDVVISNCQFDIYVLLFRVYELSNRQ